MTIEIVALIAFLAVYFSISASMYTMTIFSLGYNDSVLDFSTVTKAIFAAVFWPLTTGWYYIARKA